MVAKRTERALELLLLNTALSQGLDRRILDIVRDTINNPPPEVPPELPVVLPPFLTQPHYEPWIWNDNDITRATNNCYNYANDRITNTYAQPGRGSGMKYQALTPEEVMQAAIRDHLEFWADAQVVGIPNIVNGGDLVVLVMAPIMATYWDFHWYRRDYSGYWSHKPGSGLATDLDNANNPILDPRTASRGPYHDVVAFMTTNEQVVMF